jgi:multisubunit Na+/H+ antiporter MnhB subunit
VLVIVVVMALRVRSMSRIQPLKPERMWILPLILVALAGVTLWAHPPSPAGMAIGFTALVVGCVIGWQRGRFIHVERAADGTLTQKASPAALMLLIAIIGARYAVRSYFGASPDANGEMSEQALIATDALLLFAVGLIAITRVELAIRARRILAGTETPE